MPPHCLLPPPCPVTNIRHCFSLLFRQCCTRRRTGGRIAGKKMMKTKIKFFKDKGCSGQNTDRPEFQRLLDEIRKGKVRRVIVYKLDRIPSCSATRYTRRPTWNCMSFSRARERQSSMTPPTSPGQMAAISTRGGT